MPDADLLPVIAIAGLGIESSTFSAARTLAPDFHPQRGVEVLNRYPFLAAGQPLRRAADWRGALVGKALPGGMVAADAFRLGHHRIHRPMHPFDSEVRDPDLGARLIPASSQPMDQAPGW